MSVLDDIRSSAEGANETFDDALALTKQAMDEASDLEQSAAGHGWSGVAEVMASAQEALETVTSAIEGAVEATTQGLARLSEITVEMSSDEIAGRLAAVKIQFDAARHAASQATDALDEARTAAAHADAESLLRLVHGADERVETGRETLAAAVDLTESEQSEATAWGN